MEQNQDPAMTSSTRTLTAFLAAAAIALGATGCVMEPGTYVVEDDDYPTARYYDYVVYYTDVGRPYYYLDGAMVFVPETYPGYQGLVVNYRRHRTYYQQHGYPGNRPPPDRFDPPRRASPPDYANDVRRNSAPPPRQYGETRAPAPERFQPPQRNWSDSAQPAPRRGPPSDANMPSQSASASRDQWQPAQRDWGGRGSSAFERTESPAPRPYRTEESAGREPSYMPSRGADRSDRWDGPGRGARRGDTPSDAGDQGVRPADGQRFRDQ